MCGGNETIMIVFFNSFMICSSSVFGAFTLLIEKREEHSAYKTSMMNESLAWLSVYSEM